MTTAIATDLLTPLGAYLRLREDARASFLLESVDRGRLGRYSFVGSGSRLVHLDQAEAAGQPGGGWGRGGGAPGGRVGGVGLGGRARADGAAAGRRTGPAGEPLRRCGHAHPLRP